MSLSRWWREWQIERSFKRSVRADLARIGKEYEAKFKLLAAGSDFDAAMAAYMKACRLPDLRIETLRSRRIRRAADAVCVELPREAIGHKWCPGEDRFTFGPEDQVAVSGRHDSVSPSSLTSAQSSSAAPMIRYSCTSPVKD